MNMCRSEAMHAALGSCALFVITRAHVLDCSSQVSELTSNGPVPSHLASIILVAMARGVRSVCAQHGVRTGCAASWPLLTQYCADP